MQIASGEEVRTRVLQPICEQVGLAGNAFGAYSQLPHLNILLRV